MSEEGTSVDNTGTEGLDGSSSVNDALLNRVVSEGLVLVSELLTTNNGLGWENVNLRGGQLLSNGDLSKGGEGNLLDLGGNGNLRNVDLRDFLSGLVNNLLFDGLVFDSFLNSFGRNVFNVSVLIDLRNVFSLVFNGVVVGDLLFLGNVFNSLDSFVFNDGLFVGNVFDSRFTLDDFSLDGGGDGNAGNLNTRLVEDSTADLLSTQNLLTNNLLTAIDRGDGELRGGVDGVSNNLRLNQRLLLNVLKGVLQNLGLNVLGLLLLLQVLLGSLFGLVRHLC